MYHDPPPVVVTFLASGRQISNAAKEVQMSVESTELERSALERKDRDELQTIAEAMGGSPGTRARKGEIVDLILELAGVSTGTDAAEASEGNGSAAAAAGDGEPPKADGDAAAPEAKADEGAADEPPA